MKKIFVSCLVLLAALLIPACSENIDPLSPGSTSGHYSLAMKSLVPLAVGNYWNYNVVLYDAAGAEKTRYTYTLRVLDMITADTNLIRIVPPITSKKSISREALSWFLLEGEMGARTCWQVDTVENLRIRSANDVRFTEQTAFNFRASLGDSTVNRAIGADTTYWGSGDRIVTIDDTVRTVLASKGNDSLRTTLGSAPYFQYTQKYVTRTDYTKYYFKPGFGLFLIEKFSLTSGGKPVRVRRDELVSYFLK